MCIRDRVDTATLEVEVLREQGINSVFTQLSEQGIQVLSMRNKANRQMCIRDRHRSEHQG